MRHAFFALISYWRLHKLQCAISIFGVALGVAVVTAMDLANASALGSFRESMGAVSGKATHQVVPAEGFYSSGVPEELFAKIQRTPGVIAAAPVVEAHGVVLPEDGALANRPVEEVSGRSAVVRILGIDPFSEEPFRGSGKFASTETKQSSTILQDWLVSGDGCVLPEDVAAGLNLKPGQRFALLFSGKRFNLKLLSTYSTKEGFARGSNDLMIMDIAAAQERFLSPGQISTIDLILADGSDGDRTAEQIRSLLPKSVVLQRPAERTGRTEALLEAFQLNLTALSLLALVVGIFLVHNTLTVAVLQRIPIIGTLRCIGVSAAEIRRAVLLEAVILGTAGSLLGLIAGTALAGLFLQRVGGIVSDLYAHVGALSIFFDKPALIKGAALGILASLGGAFFPAWEAGAITPVQVLRRSSSEARAERSWRPLAMAGVISFAVALVLALIPVPSPVPGLGSAFAVALGGALCAPAFTRWISFRITPILQRLFGTLGLLSARGIAANLSRTGLAVGALGMALSMTIGVALMISSFRGTLDRWMDQTLYADIYIRPAGPSLMRHKSFLSDELLQAVRARPEVDAIDTYRGRDALLPDGSLILTIATDSNVFYSRARQQFPFMSGDPKSAFEGLQRGDVLISESLSRKQNLDRGDSVSLSGADGQPRKFKIAGVYYEYATDRGVVNMDVKTYANLYGDGRANSLAIYLKAGVDLESARTALRREFGAPNGLYIFSNRTLREEAFRVFDRTFAITGQLEHLSLAVGLCGILSALLAMLRERSSDFALLRALGLTSAGLSRLVILEGMLLGLVAFGVACILGPVLALLLIHVINIRAFGWTIQFAMNAEIFIRVGVLALLISALAGFYPSLHARRLSISAALRAE